MIVLTLDIRYMCLIQKAVIVLTLDINYASDSAGM